MSRNDLHISLGKGSNQAPPEIRTRYPEPPAAGHQGPAPPSTKKRTGERDPEMHQTHKGNQWRFGMKAHIGVDADSGLVHTVISTAANVNDVTQGHGLRHGKEPDVFADAGYQAR